jgi:hypothetical protein
MRRVLDVTIAQLAAEFGGVFSRETVARCVWESFERVGDRPAVGPNFLPVIPCTSSDLVSIYRGEYARKLVPAA